MLTFPTAKINIGLQVTERRPDGYHNLDTVFYPIPINDALEVIVAEGAGLIKEGTVINTRPAEKADTLKTVEGAE